MIDRDQLARSADYYLARFAHRPPATFDERCAVEFARGIKALLAQLRQPDPDPIRAAAAPIVAVLSGLPAMTSWNGQGLSQESYLVPAAEIRALAAALQESSP